MRLLRQLCKNASMSTNVMKQDCSDLNHLAKRLIKLEQVDDNTFRCNNLLQGRMNLEFLYGGQSLSSSIRAAAMTVSPDFLPHNAHLYCVKSGDVNKPLELKVKRVRDGRSFCTRYVETLQDGDLITSGIFSFHTQEEPAIQHQQILHNNYPHPESLKSWTEVMKEALNDTSPSLTAIQRKILQTRMERTPPVYYKLLDIRPIDPLRWTMRTRYSTEKAPSNHGFIKCNGILGDNQLDHYLMGAFISDLNLILTSVIDHNAAGFFQSMLFSLDQQVFFHGPFNVNEWLLFECTSPIADGGRAYAEGRAWTLDGRLVMSIPQEGIVRSRKTVK